MILTERAKATTMAPRREDLREMRGAAGAGAGMRRVGEAGAGMRGVGEAGAKVTAVTSQETQESSHSEAPVKSGIEDMTQEAMAQIHTEEKNYRERRQERSVLE